MHTFADGLRHCNDLDLAPGEEALEKMGVLCTAKVIDILLSDAVSLPGVSLHYLLRSIVERSRCGRAKLGVQTVSQSWSDSHRTVPVQTAKSL